ncbi:amidohydrolase family protein [Actinomycetes bacterium KLBMP 9797]
MSAPARHRIHARRLFDGHDVLTDQVVETEGGTVTAVGPAVGPVPAGATVVDFLLPGLIDGHTHLTGYRDDGPREPLPAATRSQLRLCLSAGVTTLRDLGNYLEPILLARQWSVEHHGPRIYTAGPLLDGVHPLWSSSRVVTTEAQARDQVGRLAAGGVDLVKVYGRVEPELVPAIVDAARGHRLPVSIHCGRTTAVGAAAAGVDCVEHLSHAIDESLAGQPTDDLTDPHASRPDALVRAWASVEPDGPAADRFVDVLRRYGTAVCPTLLVTRRAVLFDEQLAEPHLAVGTLVMPHHRHLIRMRNPLGLWFGRKHLPAGFADPDLRGEPRRVVERGLARLAHLLVRLRAAGVPVVAGTDSPASSLVPGHSLHQELAALADAGLTPLDCLRAATSAAATLLGEPRLGVVRPGAYADLVAVSGDPAREITDTRRISAVMCRGRWVDRDRLTDRLNADLDAALAR